MQQTLERKIKDLEVRLSRLEKELSSEVLKTTMLDTLIEVSGQEELDFPARKSISEQSKNPQ